MASIKRASRIDANEIISLANESVPIMGELGIEVERLDWGVARLRAPFQASFLRPGGTLSGPVLMALADFAMYAAVLTRLGRVDLAVTINLNMNFMRRPRPADVIAQARILKLGRQLAVGDIFLYTAQDDDPVAHATSTYSVPPRAPGS